MLHHIIEKAVAVAPLLHESFLQRPCTSSGGGLRLCRLIIVAPRFGMVSDIGASEVMPTGLGEWSPHAQRLVV
ncbi:hypothetical protein NC651_032139 [Populus alba x Populus x berolinensis]|nr:hypothetical protein NC651_032139 [Populus alba x Populus x berolinensis]